MAMQLARPRRAMLCLWVKDLFNFIAPQDHLMEEEVICGVCDLCGDEADGNVSECNALSCTFAQCGLSTDKGILYHQACLDKFLRKEKLDKSRKTGFKCPRGCGKGSKFSSECPGRV